MISRCLDLPTTGITLYFKFITKSVPNQCLPLPDLILASQELGRSAILRSRATEWRGELAYRLNDKPR